MTAQSNHRHSDCKYRGFATARQRRLAEALGETDPVLFVGHLPDLRIPDMTAAPVITPQVADALRDLDRRLEGS